jgi:hypothetical protein
MYNECFYAATQHLELELYYGGTLINFQNPSFLITKSCLIAVNKLWMMQEGKAAAQKDLQRATMCAGDTEFNFAAYANLKRKHELKPFSLQHIADIKKEQGFIQAFEEQFKEQLKEQFDIVSNSTTAEKNGFFSINKSKAASSDVASNKNKLETKLPPTKLSG